MATRLPSFSLSFDIHYSVHVSGCIVHAVKTEAEMNTQHSCFKYDFLIS